MIPRTMATSTSGGKTSLLSGSSAMRDRNSLQLEVNLGRFALGYRLSIVSKDPCNIGQMDANSFLVAALTRVLACRVPDWMKK